MSYATGFRAVATRAHAIGRTTQSEES